MSNNSSQEDVKEAFVNLAKRYHPDSNLEADTEKFQNVQQLYSVLETKLLDLDINYKSCYFFKVEKAYRKLQEKFSLESESILNEIESATSSSASDEESSKNQKVEEHDIEVKKLNLDI